MNWQHPFERKHKDSAVDRRLAAIGHTLNRIAASVEKIAMHTQPPVSNVQATTGKLILGPPTSELKTGEVTMPTSRSANWSIGEGYNATFTPTKADGSPGKIQAGSGKFSSNDPAVTITQSDDLNARIDATGNGDFTISFDGDGDLGTGVQAIHVEGVASFSDSDVEATGGGLDFGEPVPKNAPAARRPRN